MKRTLVAISSVVAAACGGSSDNNSFANFEGAAWNASVSAIATCPPPVNMQAGNRTYSLTFAPGNGADLQVTSTEGCVYKFNLSNSNYTATLVNAPVSCTATISGITATVTWTSYTATTTDGHNLTINTAGTATNGSLTCSFTETGSATR